MEKQPNNHEFTYPVVQEIIIPREPFGRDPFIEEFEIAARGLAEVIDLTEYRKRRG